MHTHSCMCEPVIFCEMSTIICYNIREDWHRIVGLSMLVNDIQRQFTELERKLNHYNAENNKLKKITNELERRYLIILMYYDMFTCIHVWIKVHGVTMQYLVGLHRFQVLPIL